MAAAMPKTFFSDVLRRRFRRLLSATRSAKDVSHFNRRTEIFPPRKNAFRLCPHRRRSRSLPFIILKKRRIRLSASDKVAKGSRRFKAKQSRKRSVSSGKKHPKD